MFVYCLELLVGSEFKCPDIRCVACEVVVDAWDEHSPVYVRACGKESKDASTWIDKARRILVTMAFHLGGRA